VGGRDALRFVDSFTTAALQPVLSGEGTPGFFTDARGWVLLCAALLRSDDGLWIDGPWVDGWSLAEHLERYHIREQLQFHDFAAERRSLVVAGPDAAEWLASRCDHPLPKNPLNHSFHGPQPATQAGGAQVRLCGVPVMMARVDWAGIGGFLVSGSAFEWARLVERFAEGGVVEADAAALEIVRIEQGLPLPKDIPAKALPQELVRGGSSISFTKGCYLGQETVARIDALGHVNRHLMALATDLPAPLREGAEVRIFEDGGDVAGGVAGVITSSCLSPLTGGHVGLAMLLARASLPGAIVRVDGANVRVVSTPLPLETWLEKGNEADRSAQRRIV
jgi:folate-binding protein YgfZ